jgi:hypothetical protein
MLAREKSRASKKVKDTMEQRCEAGFRAACLTQQGNDALE